MEELPALDALALSLHHAPGVYALHVGSGLSSAAGIPTGWQITLKLIQKLKSLDEANLVSNESDDDLFKWYRDKYKKEPNYSDVIKYVAKTSGDRQNALETFFKNREPTAAHKKIAQLVKTGKIRVIITTNFDRLLEQALTTEGIEPQIIDNDDRINGTKPITHSECTLIKLNGDYLDIRIKNTEKELEKYSLKLKKQLNRILDEYGLIVVGWSGDWDLALHRAIIGAPNRRYQFYWAAHKGEVGEKARGLITHRGGQVINIQSADEFFKELADKVEGLDRLKRPHPYSVKMALELAKKYCRDDQYAMEWTELLHKEFEQVREYVASVDYPYHQNNNLPADQKLNNLIEGFIARTEILRRACMICGRWGTDKANREAIEVIRSLAFNEFGFDGTNIELRSFGASLCFYWHAVGLVEAKNWLLLKELFNAQIKDDCGNIRPLVYHLPPQSWYGSHPLRGRNSEKKHFIIENFFNNLSIETKDILLSESRIDELHMRVECYISAEFILYSESTSMSSSAEDFSIILRRYYHELWLFRLRSGGGREFINQEKIKIKSSDEHIQFRLPGKTVDHSDKIFDALKSIVEWQF